MTQALDGTVHVASIANVGQAYNATAQVGSLKGIQAELCGPYMGIVTLYCVQREREREEGGERRRK